MSHVDLFPETTSREIKSPPIASGGAMLAELSSLLFASLTRSDQCMKATYYLRGLLEAQGRKSIRAIAALFGDHVSEQNLHHFISDSTWDWVPMRQALAEHLVGVTPPQAWVVRPTIIPKSGRHSVGVDKRFFPALGQVLNAQRAIGVWAVSEDAAVPVNWRLHLPKAWLKDHFRRNQVSIPDEVGPESLSECVVGACAETVLEWELPVKPVVFDTCEAHAVTIFGELAASGVPLMVKVGGDLRLTVTDPVLPASGGRVLPARQIMGLAGDLRRPAAWKGPGPRRTWHTHLAAAVRVATPVSTALPAECDDLVLLGVGGEGGRGAAELWLTNMTATPTSSLARLSKLTGRVDRDFAAISDQVGIRDFSGRSFSGWHRHVTLASAAHAAVALAVRNP